jgi:hypothetical protein
MDNPEENPSAAERKQQAQSDTSVAPPEPPAVKPDIKVPVPVQPAEPATQQQLQNAEEKIEERMSAFERSMIRLTQAGVVVGIITLCIFGGQLYEMIEGGTQTDKIVTASQKIQSALTTANSQNADAVNKTLAQSQDAMNKTLIEMQKESSAMQKAALAASNQVQQLQAGVDETSKLASAAADANKIAQQATWTQTRPLIGVEGNPNITQFASGGSGVNFTLTLHNYGQYPAKLDEPYFLLGDIGKGETRLLPSDLCSHSPSRFLTPIFPGREIERRIQAFHTADSMPSPNSKRFDYLYGCIVYHGAAGSPPYNLRVIYYVLYSEDITRIEKIEFRDLNVE